MMKLFFALGIVGYYFYNFHLLTIEDLPTSPGIVLGVISGFAIGAMITSVDLVMNNKIAPIQYNPIIGGKYFILSLLLLNLIGISGFILSIITTKSQQKGSRINILDFFAIFNFFISPTLIYLLRIMKLNVLPFNFIFLNTELAFICHLISFILFSKTTGYPIHAKLISFSLIDLNTDTVVGGYSSEREVEFNKLQGMALIAIDSVIDQVFNTSRTNQYVGNYGNALMIRKEQFLMVCLFRGKGKKIGKRVFNRFLNKFVEIHPSLDLLEFQKLTRNCIYPFIHKKYDIKSENIYFSKVRVQLK